MSANLLTMSSSFPTLVIGYVRGEFSGPLLYALRFSAVSFLSNALPGPSTTLLLVISKVIPAPSLDSPQ